MDNFFVLGMPRCRSLWLSHLLSYGSNYCFHEYLSNCENQPNLPEIEGMTAVGSCDTHPLGFNPELVGDSPLLIVTRPLNDVKDALTKSFGYNPEDDPNDVLEDSFRHLLSIKTSNSLIVSFADFNDIRRVKYIIKFLGLTIPNFHIHKLMGSMICVKNTRLGASNHAFNKFNKFKS